MTFPSSYINVVRQTDTDTNAKIAVKPDPQYHWKFLVVMGSVQLPNQNMYWTKNELLNSTSIAQKLQRNRFQKNISIVPYNMSNNQTRGQPGHDKIPFYTQSSKLLERN